MLLLNDDRSRLIFGLKVNIPSFMLNMFIWIVLDKVWTKRMFAVRASWEL